MKSNKNRFHLIVTDMFDLYTFRDGYRIDCILKDIKYYLSKGKYSNKFKIKKDIIFCNYYGAELLADWIGVDFLNTMRWLSF